MFVLSSTHSIHNCCSSMSIQYIYVYPARKKIILNLNIDMVTELNAQSNIHIFVYCPWCPKMYHSHMHLVTLCHLSTYSFCKKFKIFEILDKHISIQI